MENGIISKKIYIIKTLVRVELLLGFFIYPIGLITGLHGEQYLRLTLSLFTAGLILGLLASSKNYNTFVRPLNLLAEFINSLHGNDLTYRIDLGRTPGHREVFRLLNEATDGLDEIIRSIRLSASTFIDNLDDILDIFRTITRANTSQLEMIEKAFSSLSELTASVFSNEQNAEQADRDASLTLDAVMKGDDAVVETLKAMEKASLSSRKINEIIDIVNSIAFQTNLLALNAAVEAARAGEHGRGFAVVAGEVRNLAKRSAEASADVQKLVNDTVQKIAAGNTLVLKTADSLNVITDYARKITKEISEINAASREQSTALTEVNNSVKMIHESAGSNVKITERAIEIDELIKRMARTLLEQTSKFTVNMDGN